MSSVTGRASGAVDVFDVVVFDYSGVCTPSASEFIASTASPLAALRPMLSSVVAELQRRKSTVVLLSNEFDREWIRQIEGFPEFDHVLVGSDNGVLKPDRRAFQRVLHVTGCDAGTCLVVDDDDTNVRVARSIGCHAIHFDTTDVFTSWEAVLGASPSPDM